VDKAGSAYVTGTTGSRDFPTTPGAFQPIKPNQGTSVFVTKFDPSGSTLEYSTFLGGTSAGRPVEGGAGIAVDALGRAYVTGSAQTQNFPTTPNAFQRTGVGPFLTKLTADGSGLLYSTKLAGPRGGGNATDLSHAIAVTPDGVAYIAGGAVTTDFPTTPGAFQEMKGSAVSNAFIAAFDTQAALAGFQLSFPSPVTAGTLQSFTVTVVDGYGNPVTDYVGTVHFTSSDPQADLPQNYTFVASDQGVHTFTATLKTAGTQSITATDLQNSAITSTQEGIVVTPAPANHFQLDAPDSVSAGMPFDLTVTAMDPYGNVDVNYTGTVTFTSSDRAAQLPDDYPFPTDAGGMAVFTVTLNTAGEQTVTATDTSDEWITGTATVMVGFSPGGGFRLWMSASELTGVPFNAPAAPWDQPEASEAPDAACIASALSELDFPIMWAKDHSVWRQNSGVCSRLRGPRQSAAVDQDWVLVGLGWELLDSVTVGGRSACDSPPGW
jgi:hypothetical protein